MPGVGLQETASAFKGAIPFPTHLPTSQMQLRTPKRR